MRHDPSLVDMTGPQLPLEAEEDINVTHAVQRKNPCALCNVGFFHGYSFLFRNYKFQRKNMK